MREVIEFDLEELDWRAAFTGLVGLLIALVFLIAFGPVGMAAGVAVLFVVGSDTDDSFGPDLAQVVLVVAGAIVTVAVGAATSSTAAAAIVLGAVALCSTLLVLLGPRWAGAGAYTLIWAVLSLTIGITDESARAMGLAFGAGGLIALAVLWVSARLGSTEMPDGVTAVEDSTPSVSSEQAVQRRRPLVLFSIVRALATSAAVVVGFERFPDHAAWVVLTFVLVLRPPRGQTTVVAAGRTLGTVIGVLFGMAAAQLAGDSLPAQLLAFSGAGFFMLATTDVNYALSTAFTTAMLLLSERILHQDVYETGWERIRATLVGVVIAFLVIGIMAASAALWRPPSRDAT